MRIAETFLLVMEMLSNAAIDLVHSNVLSLRLCIEAIQEDGFTMLIVRTLMFEMSESFSCKILSLRLSAVGDLKSTGSRR